MLSLEYWEKAAAFHGHKCPGLAIGFKACEGAIAALGLDESTLPVVDEEVVCVTENDACCVDAIQVILGCTYGKANLIPRLRGKMAFTFFVRDTDRAVRLYLRHGQREGRSREEFQDYLINTPYEEVFEVTSLRYPLPEPARFFADECCEVCGESTAEYALRIQEGKPVCLDCYCAYEREGF